MKSFTNLEEAEKYYQSIGYILEERFVSCVTYWNPNHGDFIGKFGVIIQQQENSILVKEY